MPFLQCCICTLIHFTERKSYIYTEIIYYAAKRQWYSIKALSVHGLGLPIERVWVRDCPNLNTNLDWHDVWSNIPCVSHNPDHQQIHYNFIHRTYLTPLKMHHMNVINSPLCTFCPLKTQGTYLRTFWD